MRIASHTRRKSIPAWAGFIALASTAIAPGLRRAEACLMRDMAYNAQHIMLGTQYLAGSVNPLNQGGGAASIFVGAPGLT